MSCDAEQTQKEILRQSGVTTRPSECETRRGEILFGFSVFPKFTFDLRTVCRGFCNVRVLGILYPLDSFRRPPHYFPFGGVRGGFWSVLRILYPQCIQRKKNMVYAQCHPDRQHKSKGFCSPCYQKSLYDKDKEKSRWAFRSNAVNRKRRNSYTLDRSLAQKTRERRRNYGLSDEDYEGILLNQDGRCDLCHDDECTSFHIDHDHDTRTVRGLLCSNCNTGIGKLGDNIRGLQRALGYLQRKAVCGI